MIFFRGPLLLSKRLFLLMHKNVKLLYWLNFFIDFSPSAPIAVLYFSKVAGSFALGMSVYSIIMLAAALFQIPTGILSDLYGRKITIVLGAFSQFLGSVFFAVGGYYYILLIGAALMGLGRAFYSGNNEAILFESLKSEAKEKDYHHFLGKTSSMFQVALASSAFIGGFIANRSFVLVMWVTVIPQFLAFVVSLFFIEPPKHYLKEAKGLSLIKESFKQFKLNMKLRLLTFAQVIDYAFGEAAYQFRTTFIATLWPVWAIGIASFMNNLFAAVSYFFSGKVISKFSPYKIFFFEVIYGRIVNLSSLIFPTVVSPVLMSTTSLTYGVGNVTQGMLLQKEYSDQQRATLGSLISLAGSMTFAVVAIIIGAIGDKIGPAKTLIIINIILFAPLIFYRKIFKHR